MKRKAAIAICIYFQIKKGIPALERTNPEVDYVDIYTGEVVYTHEF